MEKNRHGKHKEKKRSKKRKSRDDSGSPNNSIGTTNNRPLVEYSDVSSEALSGPEAGEIQSGEEGSLKTGSEDGELDPEMHRSSHRRYSSHIEEEMFISRKSLSVHSPGELFINSYLICICMTFGILILIVETSKL